MAGVSGRAKYNTVYCASHRDRMMIENINHRRKLRALGHDPDFIGTTEVKPVCCTGCGQPIPWRVLRGWQD